MSGPQTLDDVMRWLREGQLPIDRSLPADPDKDRRSREMQAAFHAYPGVLETILDMTIRRPAADYTLPRDGRFQNYLLIREGQNQVTAGILAYLSHAEGLKNASLSVQPTPRAPEPGGADGFSAGGASGPDIAVS